MRGAQWTLGVIAAALVVLLGVVGLRTGLVESKQRPPGSVAAVVIDAGEAIDRLSRILRFETVSHEDSATVERSEFLALHRYLEQAFPQAHRALQPEVVGGASLLYTWGGSDPSLDPILLGAHLDVVPVEPGTESTWTHPPFSGAVADGYVWGRGALDMKFAVTGMLEAVETLISQRFVPRRTVYLAFGHDEELGGQDGAAEIAARLEARGVRLRYTLDEGSIIISDLVPGVSRPVALIGLAEKGSLTLEIAASGRGGHSSMPPRPSVLGKLARAVNRIERQPLPAKLRTPAADLFEWLAPEMPLGARAVIANRWLFEPLLLWRLAGAPATDALIRTTAVATIIRAGSKANVLPAQASAVINLRLLPGDSVEDVVRQMRQAVSDLDVTIRIMGQGTEASSVSAADSGTFAALQQTVHDVFPQALVAPSLVVTGTDTRHYRGLAENSYRFMPLRLGPADLDRIHGADERIAVENYLEVIRFFIELMRVSASR